MSTVHQIGQPLRKNKRDKRLLCQPPVVIHHGVITTRAGSNPPTLTGDPDKSGVDPADLFGNGG